MKKKRNPQDSTLRNIRALKKLMKDFEARLQISLHNFDGWIGRLRQFESRLEFLERKDAFKVSNEAIKTARKGKK